MRDPPANPTGASPRAAPPFPPRLAACRTPSPPRLAALRLPHQPDSNEEGRSRGKGPMFVACMSCSLPVTTSPSCYRRQPLRLAASCDNPNMLLPLRFYDGIVESVDKS